MHEERGALILNVCNVLSKAFTLCPFVWNLPGMEIWVRSILCFKMATAFSWACLCFCSVLFCWFSFFLFFCFCFFFLFRLALYGYFFVFLFLLLTDFYKFEIFLARNGRKVPRSIFSLKSFCSKFERHHLFCFYFRQSFFFFVFALKGPHRMEKFLRP